MDLGRRNELGNDGARDGRAAEDQPEPSSNERRWASHRTSSLTMWSPQRLLPRQARLSVRSVLGRSTCILHGEPRRNHHHVEPTGNDGLMRPNYMDDPQGEAWDAYIWVDDVDSFIASSRRKA